MVTVPEGVTWVTRDNGGVLRARGVNYTPLEGPFGRVLASLTRVAPTKKYRRGDLVPLVVLGRRRWTPRAGGIASRLGYNGVIPTRKDGGPVGSRMYGVVLLEARLGGYSRLAVVARGLL